MLIQSTWKNRLQVIIGLFIVLWVVELLNLALNHSLGNFGIYPRTLIGLRGIVLSPFIHHGIMHLSLNSIPFLVLGGLVILRGVPAFSSISIFIIVVGGAGVWLFARPAYHAGASGLIFGYFGFLVAAGWYEKKFLSIIIALVVLFLYGGIIWGVLPSRPFVSWEGHLFGLLAGVIGARFFLKKK